MVRGPSGVDMRWFADGRSSPGRTHEQRSSLSLDREGRSKGEGSSSSGGIQSSHCILSAGEDEIQYHRYGQRVYGSRYSTDSDLSPEEPELVVPHPPAYKVPYPHSRLLFLQYLVILVRYLFCIIVIERNADSSAAMYFGDGCHHQFKSRAARPAHTVLRRDRQASYPGK
nr:hypothetical protein CFP56_73024 [Quercus suber]